MAVIRPEDPTVTILNFGVSFETTVNLVQYRLRVRSSSALWITSLASSSANCETRPLPRFLALEALIESTATDAAIVRR
jgi:hypothetical protein